jgi:hypothetical protein
VAGAGRKIESGHPESPVIWTNREPPRAAITGQKKGAMHRAYERNATKKS